MPRYFFDWRVLDDLQVDRRGMQLPDVSSAREVATDCAVDLVTDDIRRGDAQSVGTIIVRDALGNDVHRISLAQARELALLTATTLH